MRGLRSTKDNSDPHRRLERRVTAASLRCCRAILVGKLLPAHEEGVLSIASDYSQKEPLKRRNGQMLLAVEPKVRLDERGASPRTSRYWKDENVR